MELVADKVDSFPWRLRVADVSCYTLEGRVVTSGGGGGGGRSQLRETRTVTARTFLDLLTTTITVSVVTKSLTLRAPPVADRPQRDDNAAEDEARIAKLPQPKRLFVVVFFSQN